MSTNPVMKLALKKNKQFTKIYQDRQRTLAEKSQNSNNPYTWRFTYHPGETLDSFDGIFDRCGIWYMMQELGIPEVTPAICFKQVRWGTFAFEKFSGLTGMQEWFTSSIKPYSTGREGIVLRWEGVFEEARRNNNVRLAMNFGTTEIELVGGMEAFRVIIEGFHQKYCPNTMFEPEITYISLCNIEEETSRIDQYVSSGYFKSIDVCGGENLRPFEDFLPLYRKAEK